MREEMTEQPCFALPIPSMESLLGQVAEIGKDQIYYRDKVLTSIRTPCTAVLVFFIIFAIDSSGFPFVPPSFGGFFTTVSILPFLPILLLTVGVLVQKYVRWVPVNSRFIYIVFAVMLLCFALVVDQFIARLASFGQYFHNGVVAGTSTLFRSGGALASAIGIILSLVALIIALFDQYELVSLVREARRSRHRQNL
jgi:type II secretory pathway component PulF